MTLSFAVKYLLLVLPAKCVVGDYESAGCSDEGCGIPCYLRPAEDECHYTEHTRAPCDGGGASDLEQHLWLLNDSLVRLTEKLVQKGVIPAGSTCLPLSDIDHGGVIYSDLLLSVGVSASFMCEEGYSLHGYGQFECAVDGVWLNNDGSVMSEPPVCEESLVICESLVAIPYGHVSYQTVDTTQIRPGDVVTYSCEPTYVLEGAEYRICMSNGTWSSEEPICSDTTTLPVIDLGNTNNGTSNESVCETSYRSVAIISGGTVGVLALLCIVVTIIVTVICSIRRRIQKQATKQSQDTETRGRYTNVETVTLKATSTPTDEGSPQPQLKPNELETLC